MKKYGAADDEVPLSEQLKKILAQNTGKIHFIKNPILISKIGFYKRFVKVKIYMNFILL